MQSRQAGTSGVPSCLGAD